MYINQVVHTPKKTMVRKKDFLMWYIHPRTRFVQFKIREARRLIQVLSLELFLHLLHPTTLRFEQLYERDVRQTKS